jgi:hypothetical protein
MHSIKVNSLSNALRRKVGGYKVGHLVKNGLWFVQLRREAAVKNMKGYKQKIRLQQLVTCITIHSWHWYIVNL